MKTNSETLVLDGNTINLHYKRLEGQVWITIAFQCPVDRPLYERLVATAHTWLDHLRFDLYVCKDQVHADGKTIVLELDCPDKQQAVIRKLPYLSASIRIQAAVKVDPQPCSA